MSREETEESSRKDLVSTPTTPAANTSSIASSLVLNLHQKDMPSTMPSTSANDIADSLSKLAERRRIEKELAAMKQEALERALRGVGYGGLSTLLPGFGLGSGFASSLFVNGGGGGGGDDTGVGGVDGDTELDGDGRGEGSSPTSEGPEDLRVGGKREGGVSGGLGSVGGEDVEGQTGQPNWSYEEQFKHLYELDENPKRKEWLDDWLNFMHRIGKPVTRIPIMAKQVLDLYQLYHLVVAHGGLVEIIHKKLWREITKGLNLPSSITSAAFTLRTQYQKYLYDYECEKEGLSKPEDLQAAIDGNRREGRRNNANYSPFSLPPSLIAQKHLNGHRDEDSAVVPTPISSASFAGQHAALAAAAAYREQFAVLEAQRQLEQARKLTLETVQRHQQQTASGRMSTSSNDSEGSGGSRAKRQHLDPTSDESLQNMFNSMSSAHIKVTSRGANNNNNSLIVSMEINGTMYQGVLFAASPPSALSSTTEH